MGKFVDLTGLVFGRLTVLERVDDYVSPNGHHNACWLCECSCINHTKIVVAGYQLKTGNTKSCGCLKRERIIKQNIARKKYNDYEIQEDYVIMYTTKGEPFFVDLEDFWKVRTVLWHKDVQGYIVSSNGEKIHRLIMDCPNGLEVDHVHGVQTRNDNRKYNLRVGTHGENQMNSPVYSSNTSGVTGVYKGKRGHGWYAVINRDGKSIYLGQCDTFEEAVQRRKKAEEKYFGEWSYDNSQKMCKGDIV